MTGSAQDASHQSLVCCVYTRPISLETSKTDEHGKAVHGECYVRKTISRFKRQRNSPPHGLVQFDRCAVPPQTRRN
jgi:hypothetical protein